MSLLYSFADLRTLYAASYDSDRVVLYNSTSGFSYTLPGKRNEQPGNGMYNYDVRSILVASHVDVLRKAGTNPLEQVMTFLVVQ